MANNELSISEDQAQKVINKHLTGEQLTIVNLAEVPNHGYSHIYDMKTYIADVTERGSGSTNTAPFSCFLTIAHPTPSHGLGLYPIHPLPVIAKLLTLIRQKSSIPISEWTLDTSLSIIPFHYLLTPLTPHVSSSIISLAAARSSGSLPPQSEVYIDLLVGTLLGQLHSGVQNDWYGFPTIEDTQVPPTDAGYSWPETFTELLQTLLHEIEENETAYGVKLPYTDIRLYLSRAIGSFLFDDVEVPSLVWFTGFEEDIYITLPSPSQEHGALVAILPNLAHALWGDPLLEALMMGSPSDPDLVAKGRGPSDALMEGYIGGGGEPILSFRRQKTKRIWYSFFLALFVLTKYGKPAHDNEEWIVKKMDWARKTLAACVSALKDAPCS